MADQPSESPSIIRMAQGGAAKEVERAERASRRSRQRPGTVSSAPVRELRRLRQRQAANLSPTSYEQVAAIAERYGWTPEELLAADRREVGVGVKWEWGPPVGPGGGFGA